MVKTGFLGTFVISWSQTEIDGLEAAPVQSLKVGAAWSWRGDTICVDGPNNVLRLGRADDAEQLRRRAARKVQRLVGAALEKEPPIERDPHNGNTYEPLMHNSFTMTDGVGRYTATLIEVGRGSQPLLMFLDQLPPRDTDLWVVDHTLATISPDRLDQSGAGVICFTPGTIIRTGAGTSRIEGLREGDLIQTKDNGVQPIRWIGQRRMSGARLFAMPQLRPVRFHANALGKTRPDQDLLVSPSHRVLINGEVARSLFNTSEVLVTARDLVNGTSVTIDAHAREVTYIHLLLDSHQVMWANGLETESFHPASAALETLDATDRSRLLKQFPRIGFDPYTYGSYARRNLSMSEAAILSHAA
ncbi:MAG TPA: Hint domain-containing protein [Roseobacter sp.]|uniref:Hedgehog/Intein (Hint) domain-containing protein n=1 Tax=marine sediment metagenome TaxID=412755 RepID=A0A0F9MIC8_9ZZZZ|nr:Hint domain-containing protein [Roseobacter sp.]HEC71128.1 Hint domain-containing protein [Roseobacter sp.]